MMLGPKDNGKPLLIASRGDAAGSTLSLGRV